MKIHSLGTKRTFIHGVILIARNSDASMRICVYKNATAYSAITTCCMQFFISVHYYFYLSDNSVFYQAASDSSMFCVSELASLLVFPWLISFTAITMRP